MRNAKKQRESRRNNLRNVLAVVAMRDMAAAAISKSRAVFGAARSGLEKKATRFAMAAQGPLDGAQDRLKAVSA